MNAAIIELLVIYGVALFFLLMGIVALLRPAYVTSLFGHPQLSAEMRNEVRAVYGGFGVAIAIVLVVASGNSSVRSAVFMTVAIALFGMAAGRVISFALERPNGKYPLIFFVVEIILGTALLLVR